MAALIIRKSPQADRTEADAVVGQINALLADLAALSVAGNNILVGADAETAVVADLLEHRTKLAAAIVDLAALRTPIAALVTDNAAARTEQAAIQADLATLRTAFNTLVTSYNATLAKLDADATVTDTDYAATNPGVAGGALTSYAPAALSAAAPAALTATAPAANTAVAPTSTNIISQGGTAGRIKAAQDLEFLIGGTVYVKPATDDLWNLSALATLSGTAYRATALYLDASGVASIASAATSTTAAGTIALLEAIPSTKSRIGVYVAAPSTVYTNALDAQGTYYVGMPVSAAVTAVGISLVTA